MKTTVLGIMLALSMIVSGFPVTAFAAETGEMVSGDNENITEGIEKEDNEVGEAGKISDSVTNEEGKTADSTAGGVSETQEETADNTAVEDNETDQMSEQASLKENSWRYSNGELIPETEQRAVYSFDAWTKVDGYFINSKGEIIPNAVKKGIDVSEHQGVIDWNAVKNSDVEFVIIRCGYGDNYTSQDDQQWLRNVSECERLGIPYGVYIYSYAQTTAQAKSEADHVLRLLKGHNPTYPVYYDMEDSSTVNSKSQFAEFASIFCNAVEAAGYEAGVYANLYWWNTYLTDSRFSQWERWVAQYNYQCDYQGDYAMWQCTSSGKVSGINGNVDINFLIGEVGYWIEENGNRYYYLNGEPLTDQGYKIDGYWYYFDEYGRMLTGWRQKGSDYYYYDEEGHMASGKGLKINGYWYYFETSGAMLTGWREKGADRYYYDEEGHMASGKGLQIDGYWYYFETSGAMLTGWREKGADRYYYDEEGHMASGKGLKIDGYWYYFETSGAMLTGWREKGADWYYYDEEGHMASGKGLKIEGYWYYFETSGAMHKGWREKNGDRYYYGQDGRMLINETAVINGVWYIFDDAGKAVE